MQFLLNRWIRIAAVVALTSFAGGAAMASSHHRRRRRHHRRHHTTHEKAATKPAPVAKAPVKKVQERTGPASLKDIQRKSRGDRSLEAQADEKRDEEIKQLKKILPKITDPGQHADLLFQLAELWWEKSKYVYFREMDDWDKAYAKWMDATNHGSKAPQPKASHRESDIYRDQAVALYTRILHQYPNYPRADEVLFNLAYAMYDSGKQDQGVALYWELIKKYPTSGYVADAYLQMGEHFFDHNDVFKAQKAYQKALATGEKHVKNFAIYKLAWCDYNLGEYDSARKKFYTVIASAEKAERENPKLRGRIQLKEEALRDLVLTYSMLDQIQPAIDYYEQHAAGSRRPPHRAARRRLLQRRQEQGRDPGLLLAHRARLQRQARAGVPGPDRQGLRQPPAARHGAQGDGAPGRRLRTPRALGRGQQERPGRGEGRLTTWRRAPSASW